MLALALAQTGRSAPATAEDQAAAIDKELAEQVKYLSSDELEGRGVGTQGIDRAADYIAAQFEKLGLKTKLYEGSPFQKFNMTVSTRQGDKNELTFVAAPRDGKPAEEKNLLLGQDFNPLAIGGTARFDLPLVFVGYGITAKDLNYDDYAGIDVQGKAVLVLRHEPQQDNPHSEFNGLDSSEHAPFVRKVSNAYEHGAAAVIFVSDQFDLQKNMKHLRKRWQAAVDELAEANGKFKAIDKPSEEDWRTHREQTEKLAEQIQTYGAQIQSAEDPILAFDGAGDAGESRKFPVLYCRRGAIDPLIHAALGASLSEIEKEIDGGPTPHSRALDGWRAVGQSTVEQTQAEVKNVVAVLEGAGPHADETIVIGAHYDHLGYGGGGSADPGSHEIHNGADDNASGASRTVGGRPRAGRAAREIAQADRVFGLHRRGTGADRQRALRARPARSARQNHRHAQHGHGRPAGGRQTDRAWHRHGHRTGAAGRPAWANSSDSTITKNPGGFGPSDHSSFYAKHMPVLHFFTGSHKDYHRPSDDFDKLNIDGMRRVAELVAATATALAETGEPLHFLETKPPAAGGGGDRPYFGSIPDFSQDAAGYAIAGATKDSPAQRAGLKAGDVIMKFRRQPNRQPRRFRQRAAQIQSRRQGADRRQARQRRAEARSHARSAALGASDSSAAPHWLNVLCQSGRGLCSSPMLSRRTAPARRGSLR